MKFKKSGLIVGDAAKTSLFFGIKAVFDAVSCTLGPRGKSVVISVAGKKPFITKDGVTVAQHVSINDRVASIGADIIKESSLQTNHEAGDGTTTATVLSYSLCEGIIRLTKAGYDHVGIKRGILQAAERLSICLNEIAIKTESPDAIRQIATISANGDVKLGSIVADSVFAAGKDGIVLIETARAIETTFDITEGMKIDNRGYLSTYFVNNKQKMTCEFHDPYVFVSDLKVNSLAELVPLLETTRSKNRPLLIIADEISNDALQGLVVNSLKGTLVVCAIKSPSYGDDKIQTLHDIAAALGATSFTADTGRSLHDIKLEDLGECKKIIVDKASTVIVVDKKLDSLKTRINDVKARSEDPTLSIAEKQLIKKRIANMASAIVVINVGGMTELEVNERKDRVTDSVNATRAALHGGIILGGGVALARYSRNSIIVENIDDATTMGQKLFIDACVSPLKMIVENAGFSSDIIIERVLSADGNIGFDALTGEMCDMIDRGIIDPVNVTLAAIRSAVSIAELFTCLGCVVVTENNVES